LISDSGRLIGVMTGEGRVLNRATGNSFAARSWLSDDGDPADQATRFADWQASTGQGWQQVDLPAGWRLSVVTSRSRWPVDFPPCDGRTILLATSWAADLPTSTTSCHEIWRRDTLSATGGVAYWFDADGARRMTVRERERPRPWTRP
jgi:competence protein ComEC